MDTLRDQFIADQKVQMDRLQDATGYPGAFARLAKQSQLILISDWIEAEIKRGSNPREIGDALACLFANMMVPHLLKFGPYGVAELTLLLQSATNGVFEIMREGEAVVVKDDGTQHQVTVMGMLRNGARKP